MNKITNYLLACICMTLIMSAACKKKDARHEAGEVPEISVATPEIDSVVLHKSYPGTIISGAVTKVVGKVNGQLLAKHFTGGAHVQKGQLLFTIEESTYVDAVQKAEAALATAESQYEYYTRQYEAMKKALESDAVSQMEVAQSKASLEQAQASIKNAKAALQTARTNLGYCHITAPQSGWIDSGTVDVGNYVTGEGSSFVLATIVDNDNLLAQFNIEDTQYEQMVGRNGGTANPLYRSVPLNFTDSLPHRYTTDLYYQSPSIDTSTGTLTLKGTVANPWHELKDGMYVTVDLPYGINPKAVLVKDASIGTDQLGKYLYVVNDSDKVELTHIETGEIFRDSLRIVNKGIRPGQKYVTKALLTVRSGQTVKPVMTK